MNRPVQAFFEISTTGHGTPRNFALQDQVASYLIGRAFGPGAVSGPNVLSLDPQALAVAPQHASITLDTRDPTISLWRFEDLGSPNGSYRNNQRITHPTTLDDKDEIWLGPVGGPTSVRLVYHDPVERPPLKRWLLRPEGNNPLKIGREVGQGHLTLFSESASDHHATITKVPTPEGTSYQLSDEGSANGTFVNNVQVGAGQSVTLKPGDLVRFGNSQYHVRGLDASRMMLAPLGLQAAEHIAGDDLWHKVTLETNMWLGQYARFAWRRAFSPRSGRQYGVTLTPPQREKTLLQDVDIVVGPNDFVVLAGSSGSGKSTLMNLLSTFVPPQSGGLYYKGRAYKDRPQRLRPHIGYVPQDDIVHEQLTVFEELMYAAELRLPASFTLEEREARVNAVLKQLRMVPQSRQRINRLSGGQRKRVSIAVELLNRPGILFLDEPTEGQDLALEQSLIIMLRNLANDGTSIVLISHRLNFLDYADYVGWLAPGGHLVYFGPPDELDDYFGINQGFSPARRYAAVYDRLESTAEPAKLAAEFKQTHYYREHIAMRLRYSMALQFGQPSTDGSGGPPGAGVVSPQGPASVTPSIPAEQPSTPDLSSSQGGLRPPPPPPRIGAGTQGQPPQPPPAQGPRPPIPAPLPQQPGQPDQPEAGQSWMSAATGGATATPNPSPSPPTYPAPQRMSGAQGQVAIAPSGAVPQPEASPVAQRKRRQFPTLSRRDRAIAFSDWSFLVLMVVQPFIIGILLNILSDSGMFSHPAQPDQSLLKPFREGGSIAGLLGRIDNELQRVHDASGLLARGQTIIFALSVSAVYLGVLLAMRELVKERSIYRRERMVGLRLGPYLMSKISMLTMFNLYQSVVLVFFVLIAAPVATQGALLPWAPIEMFVTIFLTSFGGMTLGLLLSALARTQEVLGALVPLVIIPQFILNKSVIALPAILELPSRLMFTTWSSEALGSSIGLSKDYLLSFPKFHGDLMQASVSRIFGNLPLNNAQAPPPNLPDYAPDTWHLVTRWLVLLGLSAFFLALAWWRQKRRDKYGGR
jgi:ABC-type multidrug transport system ATPase subunit/pSer/pThr/pTyr-binding forkhead associated (FHA) protein